MAWNAKGEALLQDLFSYLEMSCGFSLYMIFCSSFPALLHLFRQSLDEYAQNRTRRLEQVVPDNSERLVLDLILTVRREMDHPATDAPDLLWLEAWDHADDSVWNAARLNFLARLNEHRDVLRSRHRRPVFVVLPLKARDETGVEIDWRLVVRECAPDFWSVRDLALVLDSSLVAVPGSGEASQPVLRPTGEIPNDPNAFSPELAESLLAEWRRVANKQGKDRFEVGSNAIKAAISLGRLDEGLAIAQRLVAEARSHLELHPDDLKSMRRLARALSWQSAVEYNLGRLDDALASQQASLTIYQQLKIQLGEQPRELLDLAFALLNLGDVVKTMGQLQQAASHLQEALAILRQLVALDGGQPQALRNLSVALNRLGDVAQARGQLQEATGHYRESLTIRRQLVAKLGEQPQALRDLGLSLQRLGDVAYTIGQLEEAAGHYLELLAIARKLVAMVGEAHAMIAYLAVACGRCGKTEEATGDSAKAIAYYQEALGLWQRLLRVMPDYPGATNDVSWIRQQLAGLAELAEPTNH